MNLSVGIVGLPNVGKSTLFNALLKKQVALAANYPFATIEPNVGVVPVPDQRLAQLATVVQDTEALSELPPLKPALVEFVDIAGLVKGAAEGAGLGNQFLAHIRQTQVLCHVLRAFQDEQVLREGSVSPEEDLAIVRTELQLADLATLAKQQPPKGASTKQEQQRWQLIENFRLQLEAGHSLIEQLASMDETAAALALELNLLTSKAEIFVINVDEIDLQNYQKVSQKWSERLAVPVGQIVLISAQLESDLASLSLTDQQSYLQDLGINTSGLERLAQVAYQTLGLQSFLTAGQIEVKAWTIKQGTSALEAAGVIHSDFKQHFISARVINYQDFIKYRGWTTARAAGKVRQEGRDYLMQEGDVVEFMIGR